MLWAIVALVALYTAKGGLKAVVWTDAVQCLMLVDGGLVLFFVALSQIEGGWSAMVEANPDRFHLYRPAGDETAPFLGMIAASFGVFLWYQGCNQVMIQRVLGARSTWDGLMGIVFAGFINLLRPLVTCFLGFVVYHWIHVMRRAEPLGKQRSGLLLRPRHTEPRMGTAGYRGDRIPGGDHVDDQRSGELHGDHLLPGRLPEADPSRRERDAKLVRVGRAVSVTALAAAALLAPAVESAGGIFRYFQTGVTYLSVPFITVILFGFFWKRANYAAGVFGLTAGLAIPVLVAVSLPRFGIDLHWLYNGFIAQILISIGFVIVALSTPPPDPLEVKTFLWSPRLLTQYDEGERRPIYQRVSFWWGIYAIVWFYLYWKFW